MLNGLNGLRAAREFPGYQELSGFKKFLLRGNVVDLAVAVVIGTAFTMVVNSFADSFLTPLVALITGGGRFGGVVTVDGQEFTYGAFISQVITFVLTAAVVYFVVVLPLRRLLDRGAAAEAAAPTVPSEVDLLVEIRDLLRVQHAGGATQGAANPLAAPGTPGVAGR